MTVYDQSPSAGIKFRRGRKRRWRRLFLYALLALVAACLAIAIAQSQKPLPAGVHVAGDWHDVAAEDIEFLTDLTYVDGSGAVVSEQRIFDRLFSLIDRAETFLVLDFFLLNDFAGAGSDAYRSLSGELVDRLVARKEVMPKLPILLVTDPINVVYGSESHQGLERLRKAGIEVVVTDLSRLRDSNPIYSSVYRLAFQWFDNEVGAGFLPNPFLPGDKVTLRSYLKLLNFKANHRKVAIAGLSGHAPIALVTSANPHDASSAHGNVALFFRGETAWDLLKSELSVATFSGSQRAENLQGKAIRLRAESEAALKAAPTRVLPARDYKIRLVTEGAILEAVIYGIRRTEEGDSVDVAMFYLGQRDVVEALTEAARRGVNVRLILDPNRDAFGRTKNGVPNRPVARELVEKGFPNVNVRWYDTHGEQFHTKLVVVRNRQEVRVILGSANLTRRNVADLNLEANVVVVANRGSGIDETLERYFERLWNSPGRESYTLAYPAFEDTSRLHYLQYRLMEATGLSTF